MASPKKVDSISMTATTLSDGNLPITELNRADLKDFLNNVTSSTVAIFFSGEGSDSGSSNKLIIAGLDSNGNPSATEQFASAVLPCPPYCNR